MRNQHAPQSYEKIDPLNPHRDGSMWISMGEGKNRDVAYISRPHLADGNDVPTFKMPNIKVGQWYKSKGSKLPSVTLSKTQTRRDIMPPPEMPPPLEMQSWNGEQKVSLT